MEVIDSVANYCTPEFQKSLVIHPTLILEDHIAVMKYPPAGAKDISHPR
jgi:hypothetical protein